MTIKYVCSKCKKFYDTKEPIFKCKCGGMLDLEYFPIKLSNENIIKDN